MPKRKPAKKRPAKKKAAAGKKKTPVKTLHGQRDRPEGVRPKPQSPLQIRHESRNFAGRSNDSSRRLALGGLTKYSAHSESDMRKRLSNFLESVKTSFGGTIPEHEVNTLVKWIRDSLETDTTLVNAVSIVTRSLRENKVEMILPKKSK